MPTFERRPVTVEAVRWEGDNEAEIAALGVTYEVKADDEPPPRLFIWAGPGGEQGRTRVPLRHWVVKGDDDHFWVMDPKPFARMYQRVKGGL